MISHEIPDRPWQSVSTDLFQIRGRNCESIVYTFVYTLYKPSELIQIK